MYTTRVISDGVRALPRLLSRHLEAFGAEIDVDILIRLPWVEPDDRPGRLPNVDDAAGYAELAGEPGSDGMFFELVALACVHAPDIGTIEANPSSVSCLLYTSDAADD